MKTTVDPDDIPLDGDDRLMDAMLREYARAGTAADDVFLTRLETSLATESAAVPTAPAVKRPHRRVVWSLGLAACLALAAGLIWNRPPADESPKAALAERSSASGNRLLTPLPPELIEGTPKPIQVPSLVEAPTQPPEFFVPEGTIRLSTDKPVTSSDDNPVIGSLDLITDGDKEAGEGYFVELLDGLQWVQIDLEKRAAIHAIWLWHFHSQKRAYHDVIIQISDDPQFKTGVTTIYHNDYDQSANLNLGKATDRPYVETRFGMIADGKGTRGRYVRLYSNGNTSNEMNHYIEVEVFGIPE
jgi:hypothetical protein